MTAGAPGAFGSPVILSSSGVMGCHSSPALTGWARRTAAPTKSKSASTNRRREVKIGLPFETGRYAEFERTRSLHLGELTARRSSVALTRFAVGREVRWSRPMNIVADLSNVYRWTLQGCYPPVNRAGTENRSLSRGEDSLPHLAQLRHNPPRTGAALRSASAKWGGFSE